MKLINSSFHILHIIVFMYTTQSNIRDLRCFLLAAGHQEELLRRQVLVSSLIKWRSSKNLGLKTRYAAFQGLWSRRRQRMAGGAPAWWDPLGSVRDLTEKATSPILPFSVYSTKWRFYERLFVSEFLYLVQAQYLFFWLNFLNQVSVIIRKRLNC